MANRIKIHPRRTGAFSVRSRRAVHPTEPFLLPAVHVFGMWIAGFSPRLDKGSVERVFRVPDRNDQGSIAAVIIIATTGMRFSTFEIRQYLGVGPSPASGLGPTVIVTGVTADVIHAVNGRRSAEHAAARLMNHPIIQKRFRLGSVLPVESRTLDGSSERRRHLDTPIVVLGARLQKQHRAARVLREPIGQDTSGRACAHDDEVIA